MQKSVVDLCPRGNEIRPGIGNSGQDLLIKVNGVLGLGLIQFSSSKMAIVIDVLDLCVSDRFVHWDTPSYDFNGRWGR